MKKKNLFSVIMLSSVCSCLVACNNDKKEKTADLFYAFSTENLLSDWDYFDLSNDITRDENLPIQGRDYTLRYNLSKGENEGMQLMIAAHKYIDSFDFELPTVVNENGDEISSENFSVSAVWYQEVISSLEKDSFPGFYPDALIPLENYKWRRLDHINKGRNQSLYINFVSTFDMAPGKYTGNGTLTLDNETYSIPFEVNIYDFEMPEEAHWNNSYLIWYDEIANGEKENTSDELYLTYYDYIVAHRMSPDGLPDKLERDPVAFAEIYTEKVAKNPRITTYRVPTATNNFSKKTAREYLQALIDKNIALRQAGDNETDLFKKLYFYTNDEPTPDKYADCINNDQIVFELKHELGPQLQEYPDLYNSFVHIKNLVTIGFSEELKATNEKGGVQCWCPQYSLFNSESARANYKARQNSTDREWGENVWWYGCMDPASPYPSNHLDAKLILGRCVSYMQFDYQIDGNLYWNVCYYSKQGPNIKSGRDIWYDPMSWVNCAGDGALVYPGRDFGLNHPIPTLRLESIQAGSEDYEYLYLIDNFVNEYNRLNGTSLVSRTLLQKYLSRLYINVTPYTDSKVFNEVRNELLSLCEKLTNNLADGIAELQK